MSIVHDDIEIVGVTLREPATTPRPTRSREPEPEEPGVTIIDGPVTRRRNRVRSQPGSRPEPEPVDFVLDLDLTEEDERTIRTLAERTGLSEHDAVLYAIRQAVVDHLAA